MKKIKQVIVKWAYDKREKAEEILRDIERLWDETYSKNIVGFTMDEHKSRVVYSERWKRTPLDEMQVVWRLKSRSIWLERGGENTRYFHHHANHW